MKHSGADLGGEALYLPSCQYLLKNQFRYRSKSVYCMCVQLLKYNLPILYSIIPTLGSVENSGSIPDIGESVWGMFCY